MSLPAICANNLCGAIDGMSEHIGHLDASFVARAFHEAYESLAPAYGYTTRMESAVPWAEVPEKNKRLMVAVAERLLSDGTIRTGVS